MGVPEMLNNFGRQILKENTAWEVQACIGRLYYRRQKWCENFNWIKLAQMGLNVDISLKGACT
jgi:hypothetical protein